MPVGLTTINMWYGLNLKPYEVRSFLAEEIRKSGVECEPRNLEEKAISLVGRPLYEAFIKGYTRKQWNTDPQNLPASIITRLPVRTNYDTDYFTDPWAMQGLPAEGYARLFDKIISHGNIDFLPNTDFFDLRSLVPASCAIFYSGAIDRLFDYRFGKIEWRSLCFEWRVEPMEDWQGVSVMNYTDEDVPFTRIHEFKHLHPERAISQGKTVLCTEYPKTCTDTDETYYPVNVRRNDELYALYKAKSEKLTNFYIGGRLGSYRYLDMDKTVDEALKLFKNFTGRNK
jgi:UDP-galactopyranose mutase